MSDRSFVRECVQRRPNALDHVSDSFRTDRDIVLHAILTDSRAMDLADDSLRSDRVFAMRVATQRPLALQFAHIFMVNRPQMATSCSFVR